MVGRDIELKTLSVIFRPLAGSRTVFVCRASGQSSWVSLLRDDSSPVGLMKWKYVTTLTTIPPNYSPCQDALFVIMFEIRNSAEGNDHWYSPLHSHLLQQDEQRLYHQHASWWIQDTALGGW